MSKKLHAVWAQMLIILCATLAFTTCDVTKAGLGTKVDITGPATTVSKVSNGQYLRGTVTISGDASDVLDVKTVTIIVYNNTTGLQMGSIAATLSSSGAWTTSLDTKALSGGADTQVKLDIHVVAGSGKTTDSYLIVYFDNNPPVLASMMPSEIQLKDSSYNYALSQKELIAGSFSDFGLSTVELDMGSGANAIKGTAANHGLLTTKSSFSFTVDATQFYDGSYAPLHGATQIISSGASSVYSVPYVITATDLAGNTTVISDIFYVKPGLGAPILTFTNPTTFYTSVYYHNAPNSTTPWLYNSMSRGASVTFHLFDMDGLDTSDTGLYVAIAAGTTAGIAPTAAFSSQSGKFTIFKLSDGSLTKNNLTTATVPQSDGTTKSVTQGADFSFPLPSTDGEYLFVLHAADLAHNSDVTATTTQIAAAPLDIPSAAYSGSTYTPNSRYVSLFISSSNPVVMISSPNDGSYLTSFSASGTATDLSGVDQVAVTITGGSLSSPISGTATLASQFNSSSAWTYSYTGSSLVDGTYTASFVGSNVLGGTTITPVTRVFSIDTTPPTTSITQPGNYTSAQSQYWLSGSTASFSGTATDAGSGVASVYYTIVKKGSAQPAFSTSTWTLAAGAASWNSTISLTSEGEYTLYVVAVDAIGNTASAVSRNFGVDQSPPSLTETNHPATSYTKSAFTLAGAVGDTDALASFTITESKNGATAQSVSYTAVPSSLAGVQSATYVSQSLPLAGVANGSYAYVLTATDVAGKTTVVNRTINIDTTPPTVMLNAIPAWISSAAYTIAGTGTDPGPGASGVASVQYQLDGGAWTGATWTDTSGGANTSGTWSATLSGLAEGYHSIVVRATDAASNATTLGASSFGVDLSPPNLTVAAVPTTITAATASSFTGFSGTIYDTNPAGLPALAVTSTQNGTIVANNAAIAYTGTSTTSPGNPWSYAFAVDASGHTTDGLWTFVFSATDVAGKTTSVTKSITIDTTPPTTTVTSPSSGGWASSTSLSVTGVASDGSGTGVSKVYVKADGLYVALSPTDHSAEDPTVAANGWTLATGQTSWSASLTLSGEGYKTLWVKAMDVAGNMTTAAGAIASKVNFGLDLNPPTLGFTDGVGTLVNAGFTLAGTTTDTNPVAAPTLAVVVDGGASQAVTVAAGNWTFPVAINAATHANDGSHTYVFTSTDVAGKTTTLSRTITVDTTPPTTAVSQPGSYAPAQPQYWLSGSTAAMGGTAADVGAGASGVSKVYYKVDGIANNHATDNPIAAGWLLAAGTTTWSATANLATTGEGQFTLWVAAYDNAGNLSSITSRNFGVDQNPPTLTETNHPAASYTKTSYTLAGNVGDTNALASLAITESKNGGVANAATFTSVPSSLVGVQSATYVSQSLPLGGVADGSYAYVLTATDVAGKTTVVNRTINIDTTPPTVALNAIPAWVSSAAYTISGTGGDPGAGASGVASIQYQLDGGAWASATWVDSSGGANTSGTWSATLSGLAEGNHSIVVRATDAASNATTLGASSFGVDLNPPTLTETALNTTSQVIKNASFTLTGTVSDTNPASVAGTTLNVSVSVNGAAATAATIVGSTWSYTQPKVDGTYSYVIAATDVSGKTTSLTRLVLLDSTPPTLTVSAPITSGWTSSTTLAISGTSQDGSGSGVNKIYYLVDSAANDHSSDVATWNATSGTSAPVSSNSATWATVSGALGSWTGSAGLGSAEGYKRLWVVAADNAGNTTTLTRVNAGSFTVGSTYTIAWIGTTDFTAIGASSNTIGLSFVATGAGVGTGRAFTGSGIAMPFGFDLSPPSLAETGVGTTSTVDKNSTVVFSGTSSDTDAMASTNFLTVSVDGGAATAIPFTTAPNWSYSYTVNASTHAQDGTHSFVFTATDIAGKTTTLTRNVLVDTVPPTLAVTTPASGSWSSSATLTISGTSQDGAGAGVNKIYYLVDSAANDHTGDIAAWNATNGGASPSSSTSATWTAASGLTSSWTGVSIMSAEGSKYLWVVAADKAGNTTSLTKATAGSFVSGTTYTIAYVGTTDFTAIGASSNTVGLPFVATGAGTGTGTAWSGNGAAVAFGYDISPPSLTESSVNTTSTVTKNASALFSGTVGDTDALASTNFLTVSVDGGAITAIPFTTAPNWSYTYTVNSATHAQDGTHSFLFTATDIAGKTTTLSRTVLVDTTPATLTVTSPTASSWANATPYTVTGTASDGVGAGVAQVWTIVDAATNSHATDTMTTITTGGAWQLATGTTNWTASWALGAEGNKTLWVAALDLAGNWSTTYSNINFGYDATPPALVINPLTGYNAAFPLTGTVSDSASGVASLKYKIDSGTLTSVTVAASWSSAIPAATFSALSEGTHTVTVQATDVAGNQSTQTATFLKDTTPPVLSYSNISSSGGTVVQNASPVLTGILTDASGVAAATYTLQVWNYGTQAWNTITTGASLGSPANSTNWSWTLDLSSTGLNLPDGKYQVAIGATDVPGNSIVSPTQVYFLLSRTNPSAVVTAPGLGTFQNAAFPFVGTASDPNGITQVVAKIAAGTVSFSSGTTAAYPALPVTVATGSPGVFTTVTPHGLNANDQVYIWASPMPVTPSGSLQAGTVYYVQSTPTTTSFTLSATSGGSAITISTSIATSILVGIAKDSFSTFHPSIPVTVSTSNSTMTAVNHGLSVGDIVYFQGTTLPTPVNAYTPYYVVNSTASTFQVSTASGGDALTLSTSGTSVSVWSPTHAINWMIPAMSVSGFSDGALTTYVQATAGSGKANQTSQSFTLDTTPPAISVTSPTSGTRQVGNLTIVGTTTDPGSLPSGVTGTIQYQIGKGYNLTNASSWTSANVSGGSYSWTIALGDMSAYANATFATQCDTSGNPASGTNLWKLPIVFQALDKAGNVAQLTTYYLILDPNGNIPVVTITQPATGLTFGGQERVSGTATQPTWIYSVEVAIDPTGGNNFPANPVSVSISGNTLSATSQPFTAGQMVFLSGTTAPQIGGSSVGPTTAYWVVNPSANSFQVAAASGGSPITFSSGGSGVTASVWAPATLMTSGNNVTWYYDVNTTTAYPQGGATSQTISLQARAWNSPTAGGGKGTLSGTLTSPFIMTFNSSFPQIQNIAVNGSSYYAQMITSGTFNLTATVSSSKGISKIEAVESSPLTGSTTMYSIASSYGSTTVNNSINGSYWQSTVAPPTAMTSDTFASGNTKQVMITATGSNTSLWTAAGAPAATPGTVFVPNNVSINVASSSGSFVESDSSGNFNYSVSMTLNSTALYYYTTGQYAFNFRLTDMTSPTPQVAVSSVILDEDNYYPTSTLSNPTSVAAGSLQTGTRYMILTVGSSDFTTVGAPSNAAGVNFVATGAGSGTGTVIPVLTGTSVKIQGSATDTGAGAGSIQDLSKVVVYIINSSGNLLNLKSGGSTQAPSAITAMNGSNYGAGNTASFSYPNTSSYSGYFASIDTLGLNGTANPHDGFVESLMLDGSNDDWWVQLDTTKQSDGPVTVHFVVWDAAGNATHYSQSAFISNNAPSLSNVVLGTDLTGAGTINATETVTSGFSATNFTARNKLLSFTISSTYSGSNGSLSYSLIYGGHDYLNPSSQAGVTLSNVTTNSETVTLNFASLSPSISDTGTSNGASFTIAVTDQTTGSSQAYSQAVALNIHNTDTVAPTINLAPFGQVYSTPTDSANGGVNTDSGKALGSVSAYSANIGASGGHVEYASPVTSGASAVSGQVVFKGKAWDDEYIQKITATIPGFNSGSEFTVATYSSVSGSLVGSSGTGWGFAIDSGSQSLSLADGNVLNWGFTWDSSQIATVTATNVTVTFKAYNSNSMSSSSSMVVDILPYVTSVSTSLSNAYSSAPSVFNRSAQGYYPIANTGVATLTGYNLYYSGSTTVTLNGVGAYLALSSQSKTSLTATLSSGATSGALTLKVNGIQADNNINNNSASLTTSSGTTVYYNQEPNGTNNQLLTDDLDFWVWSFNTVVSSSTYNIRYPTMHVSNAGRIGFAYDWGAQEVHVNDNGTDTQIDGSFTQFYDTAFAYDQTAGTSHYYAIGVNGDSGATGSASWNNTANSGFYWWAQGSQVADSTGAYTSGTYKAMIESDYNGTVFNAERVQQPKVVVTGTAAPYNAYMTYYDSSQNQLTFRYGTVTNGTTFGGALGNHPNTAPGSYAGYQTMATSATTYGVGLYSAVGVTSGGVAVAAWYDQANQRLVYSYNTSPTTASGAQWQTNASVVDSSFAGWYVDMAVDAADGIHIAYYNSSSGDLKYAYLSSYSATPQVVTVDSFLSTGTDIGISVKQVGSNYVPYISYYMPTFTQTSYSVRTAWRTNFSSLQPGASSDQYTGNWEVMTVPTTSYPQDFRVGIGFKSSSPVLGYSTKNGSTYTLETAQLQ
jgi:hypothetical protein